MLQKFLSDKRNGTKNAFFFLLRALTHRSFTFNSQFLYELKHMVNLSKTVWDFLFSIPFRLLLKFIFLFNKMYGLFDFKTS